MSEERPAGRWRWALPGIAGSSPVILSRWALVIGAAGLVLYGGREPLSFWPRQAFALSILVSNVLLSLYADALDRRRLRWLLTVSDVLMVAVAIAIAGQASTEFYLLYFLVLMLASLGLPPAALGALTAGVCLLYGGLLFMELGAEFFRDTAHLIRFPFLFGVAIFFGSILEEARRDHGGARQSATSKVARRYREVASDADRTDALRQIGELALSTDPPGEVLHRIAGCVQRTVRVDRCSIVVFNESDRHGYLAACSDDSDLEVLLLLPLQHYPELRATLQSGEITEMHPDDPPELWDKVQRYLPKTSPFRSALVVPIALRERVIGAFFLRDARESGVFHDEERVFCKAASLISASYLQGCGLLEEMRQRSRQDGLTGLLNYRSFREELAATLERHQEVGNARPLALAMINVDDLKQINDRHGHAAGDEAIREVGNLLARAFPTAPALCRYGGDEFFVLERGGKEEVAERAERLVIGLEMLPEETLPMRPTVSIGIAEYPTDADQPEALLGAADRAMYLAKDAGGNRIRLAADGDEADEWNDRVLEAVISVNARRLVPGDTSAFHQVMNRLLRMEEKRLDSDAVQQSLQALMEAVESKDPYTNEHSHEVAVLARTVAEKLGMSSEEVLAVEMAGLVHDIGKIGVADEILQKPGKLSTRERLQIERHPEIGAQILKPLPALSDVVPLVLHHQERWDGSGYPHGLKGNDIPLGAQVVALCDVYHALTSDRAYRPAYSTEEARRIIREAIGTDWNPEVAEIFLEAAEKLEQEVEQEPTSGRPKLVNRIA